MSALLDALYGLVPDIECKGLCFESCGFIGLSLAERERLRAAGLPVPSLEQHPCPLLDFAGRCSAYELRPMICRLYGTTPSLRCPYGCEPSSWLTDAEGHALLGETRAAA